MSMIMIIILQQPRVIDNLKLSIVPFSTRIVDVDPLTSISGFGNTIDNDGKNT
jgi:hypothetical protein